MTAPTDGWLTAGPCLGRAAKLEESRSMTAPTDGWLTAALCLGRAANRRPYGLYAEELRSPDLRFSFIAHLLLLIVFAVGRGKETPAHENVPGGFILNSIKML